MHEFNFKIWIETLSLQCLAPVQILCKTKNGEDNFWNFISYLHFNKEWLLHRGTQEKWVNMLIKPLLLSSHRAIFVISWPYSSKFLENGATQIKNSLLPITLVHVCTFLTILSTLLHQSYVLYLYIEKNLFNRLGQKQRKGELT